MRTWLGRWVVLLAAVVLVSACSGLDEAYDPDEVDDFAVTAEDTAVLIDVLANDSDKQAEPLFVTDVDDPANGTAGCAFTVSGDVLWQVQAMAGIVFRF